MSSTDQDKIDTLLDDFFAALDQTDIDAARRLVREAEAIAPDAVEVLHARAQLAWIDEDAAAAKGLYEAILGRDPSDADAWHALGMLADEAGDDEAMVKAFLEVHRLDTESDAKEPVVTPEDEELIARVARETLDQVPDPFRARLGNVAVVLAPRPERAMVEQGFDPRALGVFEGNDDE
jgi:tetratricopeptide (TPR) repeat protein